MVRFLFHHKIQLHIIYLIHEQHIDVVNKIINKLNFKLLNKVMKIISIKVFLYNT